MLRFFYLILEFYIINQNETVMTNFMEEESVSPMQVALKWGMYTGIALIFFDLILYVLGMKSNDGSNKIQYLGFLIFIVMLIMGIKAYRDQNGNMSYGQGLGTGVLISLFTGLIVAIYTYVFVTIIAPDFMAGAMDNIRDQWEAQGLSDAQIEASEGWVEMFMSPGMMAIMSIMSYGLIGLILSLIASAVLKND